MAGAACFRQHVDVVQVHQNGRGRRAVAGGLRRRDDEVGAADHAVLGIGHAHVLARAAPAARQPFAVGARVELQALADALQALLLVGKHEGAIEARVEFLNQRVARIARRAQAQLRRLDHQRLGRDHRIAPAQ